MIHALTTPPKDQWNIRYQLENTAGDNKGDCCQNSRYDLYIQYRPYKQNRILHMLPWSHLRLSYFYAIQNNGPFPHDRIAPTERHL